MRLAPEVAELAAALGVDGGRDVRIALEAVATWLNSGAPELSEALRLRAQRVALRLEDAETRAILLREIGTQGALEDVDEEDVDEIDELEAVRLLVARGERGASWLNPRALAPEEARRQLRAVLAERRRPNSSPTAHERHAG